MVNSHIKFKYKIHCLILFNLYVCVSSLSMFNGFCGSEVAHCISFRYRVREGGYVGGLEGTGDVEGMTLGGKLL